MAEISNVPVETMDLITVAAGLLGGGLDHDSGVVELVTLALGLGPDSFSPVYRMLNELHDCLEAA